MAAEAGVGRQASDFYRREHKYTKTIITTQTISVALLTISTLLRISTLKITRTTQSQLQTPIELKKQNVHGCVTPSATEGDVSAQGPHYEYTERNKGQAKREAHTQPEEDSK